MNQLGRPSKVSERVQKVETLVRKCGHKTPQVEGALGKLMKALNGGEPLLLL